MHEHRVWRPMIFICIFALAPGNGDAFTSFLLGCPGDSPVGCTRDVDCEVQCAENVEPPAECKPPRYGWHLGCILLKTPAISLLTGPGGREPLFFNDSEYAYVNFISGVGNVFGVWFFKRYLRNAAWRPLFVATILLSTALSW